MSGPGQLDVTLTRDELAACFAALAVEPPYPLGLAGPPGATREESGRAVDRILAGLVGRGLTDGVTPVPALADALSRLAAPDHLLDIRFPGPDGRAILGLGGVLGRDGVLLAGPEGPGPGGEVLRLVTPDAAAVPGMLLGLLGDIRPGRAAPVNIPAELFEQAVPAARASDPGGGLWAVADELRARGVSRPDATALARMLTGITFGATLGATRPGSADRRELRAGWLIRCQRTPSGYYLTLHRAGTLTLRPTDAPGLLRLWRDQVASL